MIVGVDGSGRSYALGRVTEQFGTRVSLSALPGDGTVSCAPWRRLGVEAGDPNAMADRLLVRLGPDAVIEIDDAHLLDRHSLQAATCLALGPVAIVMARRPTIGTDELVALDEVVARSAAVLRLGPRAPDELAGALGGARDWAAIHRASGGLIALAELLAAGGELSAALEARVERRVHLLGAVARSLLTALAVCPDGHDDVLCAAASIDDAELPMAMRELVEAGFASADDERVRLIPVVHDVVDLGLAPADRRTAHARIAAALLARRAPVKEIAHHMRLSRSWTPAAGEIYTAAGHQLVLDDPEAALEWYQDALEAGVAPEMLAEGRARAAVLLGRPGFDAGQVGGEDPNLTLLRAVRAVQAGLWAQAVSEVRSTPHVDPLLMAPGLLALGRAAELRSLLARVSAEGIRSTTRLFAEACLAACDGADPLPRFVDAAMTADAVLSSELLLDDIRSVGGTIAFLRGDLRVCKLLLQDGAKRPPPEVRVHRALLLGFFDMRSGRYQEAIRAFTAAERLHLTPRDQFVLAALEAGLARRSGDIGRQHDVWQRVAPRLIARGADILSIEPFEELLVAAARTSDAGHAPMVIATLEAMVESLGSPDLWTAQLGWLKLQVAIAAGDRSGAAAAVTSICRRGAPTLRHAAQAVAARQWLDVLDRTADAKSVVAATDQLQAVGLCWEAAHLAGQAALDQTDREAEALLLKRARALARAETASNRHSPERRADGHDRGARAATGPRVELTPRELEVAELKIAGFSTKEVASRLFTSAKTVESHVTRINAKLGCQTRAEFVAAFAEYRPVLRDPDSDPRPP